MQKTNKTVTIIDISGFVYVSFYTVVGLTFNGMNSGAIYGFCLSMLKIIKLFPNSMFIAAMDTSKQNFRHKIYEKYKANRKKTPEELLAQLPYIEEACNYFGFCVAKKIGFEADDIIASYAEILQNHTDINVNIISADKDILQLLYIENVKIFDPIKKRYITEDDVLKKFGVTSKNLIDVWALSGDSSDNIPGVPGIGYKTAATLIQKFQSLDNLIANLDQLPQNKRFDILKSEIEQAILSRKLLQLEKKIPLIFEYCESKHNNLSEFFDKFRFISLKKYI